MVQLHYRINASAIFITQWKMKQQILHRVQTDFLQFFGDFGPDTGEFTKRNG
ncbi:Uncharacterised protein [Vibrio cholerae]|nr:Uncharacterised protein [Vibrio cholerae]CSI48721.1 Uncharacterised protein [Vibrio cholerae]